MESLQGNKNIVSDKRNTKVCKDIIKGKCVRSDCLFAHTEEDFVPIKCSFERCRYFGRNDQRCSFYHESQETKEEYMERMQIHLPSKITIERELLKKRIESLDKKKFEEISQKRTDAFTKLTNREEIAKTLVKSKLCNNFKLQGRCDRAVCTFAHGLEELIPPKCAFDDTCKYFLGLKQGYCDHIHPSETREKFFSRMGYDNIPERKEIKTVLEEILPVVESVEETSKEESVKEISTPTSEGAVFRLPKDLELIKQTVEMVFNGGITKFTIEMI